VNTPHPSLPLSRALCAHLPLHTVADTNIPLFSRTHRPFCATFLNFIGYALGAVRVSALSNMGIVYIMTHDSIGLGELCSQFYVCA
jgi:transketolase